MGEKHFSPIYLAHSTGKYSGVRSALCQFADHVPTDQLVHYYTLCHSEILGSTSETFGQFVLFHGMSINMENIFIVCKTSLKLDLKSFIKGTRRIGIISFRYVAWFEIEKWI